MARTSVRHLIEEFYHDYYKWETYPASECAVFCSTHEEWGVLSNMAA